MAEYMYVVKDLVFTNDEGKYNARHRAVSYCHKNDIDESEMLEVRNDVELDYLKHLQAKGVRHLTTHEKVLVLQGFNNAKGQHILPLVEDIPFHYIDDEGIHYEWVVGNIYDLNIRLVYAKTLFDLFHQLEEGYYLKLIYLDTDGTYNEFQLQDIKTLRDKFRNVAHKQMLEQRRNLREKQLYDRLVQLRADGKITEKQTNTLYRLEAMYGKAR